MDDIPFTKAHVLRVTANHLGKQIDKSIKKSFDRMKDKPESGQEILETIDVLYKWKKMNQDFIDNNQHLFHGDKDEAHS